MNTSVDKTSRQRVAVCPGSYDPVTCGHVDVIERAAGLFDRVIAVVLTNPAKTGLFTPADRVQLLDQSLAHLPNVDVEHRDHGLVADFCVESGARVMIKGVRGESDYSYELPMALMNRQLSQVETVFIPSAPEFVHVSSSLIKDVVRHGGDVSRWVPDVVRDALAAKLAS